MALLALIVAYPDLVAEKMAQLWGREPRLTDLLAVIGGAIAALFILAALIIPHYPNVKWWQPVLFIAVMAGLRIVHGFLVRLFDFSG